MRHMDQEKQQQAIDSENEKATITSPSPSAGKYPIDDHLHYATFNARIFAVMIDAMVAIFPLFLLEMVIQFFIPEVPTATLMKIDSGAPLTAQEEQMIIFHVWLGLGNFALQAIVLASIACICWFKYGGTPGKILLGIKIIDLKTEKTPSIWQSLKRLFGFGLSIPPIMLGIFWINFSKKKQAWHDSIANTVVVFTEKSIYRKVLTKYAALLSGRKA